MQRLARLLSLASLLAFAACGDGSPPGSSGGGGADASDDVTPFDGGDEPDGAADVGGGDAESDAAADADEDAGDTAGDDVVSDVAADALDDADVPDVAEDCDTLGCACDVDADCVSGYCLDVVGRDRGVCSEFCAEECSEPGYDCRLLINEEGDAVRLCVPADDPWCEPCDVVSDCGDLRATCAPLDDGTRACLTPCDDDTRCPSGASCQRIETEDGEGRFCTPDSGLCDGCVDRDGDLHGVGPDCLGPDEDDTDETVYDGAPELCDEVDNDGDGEVDEGFDLDSDPANCGACGVDCRVEGGLGACESGVCVVVDCPEGFADCDDDASNACETDLSSDSRCGTCLVPEGEPGTVCGTCDSGVWTCGDDGDTTCEGDGGLDALNACGGCAELEDEPDAACGACDGGRWACDGLNAVTCEGDPGRNACGGCVELAHAPGDACGTCDAGAWTCDGGDALVCDGDPGDDAPASCTVLRGPAQFGGALGGFATPTVDGRYRPANTIQLTTDTVTFSPFEVE